MAQFQKIRAAELLDVEEAADILEDAENNQDIQQKPAAPGTEHIIQVGGAIIQKPRKFRKVPRPLGLVTLEQSYFRDLNQLIIRLQNIINEELSKTLAQALGQAEARLTFDTGSVEIERSLDIARVQFLKERSDENINTLTLSHGLAINNRNKENFRRTFKAVMGVDVFASEPWIQDEIAAFMRENASFIKSITDEHLADVEQIVFRNVKAGNAPSVIASELRDAFNLTQNRARLIARDQTGKFHSRLTRLRYEGAGLNRYIWRTLGDSRVRDDHEDLEGTVQEFSKPPITVKTGKRAGQRNNPGEDIQCRCYPEPIFEDLLKETA